MAGAVRCGVGVDIMRRRVCLKARGDWQELLPCSIQPNGASRRAKVCQWLLLGRHAAPAMRKEGEASVSGKIGGVSTDPAFMTNTDLLR